MRDTVSILYLHWLEPVEKHLYMSYLRSYSTFEADGIRGCNNTIKNITDNAKEPRKIKIGEALDTLERFLESPTYRHQSANAQHLLLWRAKIP